MDSSGSEDGGGRRGGLGSFGGRKRRKNDDNIFGVFAEGGDDSPPPSAYRGKGKGKKGKPTFNIAEPVSFLPGSALGNMKGNLNETEDAGKKFPKSFINRVKPQDEPDSEEEDVDPRFDLTAKPDAEPKEQGPKPAAKNKMSFAQMSSSYGKGFAMLQKMGFSGGGLGKHEDGIANPIEVKVRQGKQGIQDEDEKVDQDLYGNEKSSNTRSVEELLGSSQAQSSGPKASEGWKKDDRGGAKRPKTVYKTAAEVAAQAGEPKTMRIIDMRGPETKVASSFSELRAAISGDTVKSLKELRHNTRLLVAKYEDKIRSFAERKKHYEDILLAVSKEQEQTKAAKSLSPSDVKHCKNMVKKIEDLRRLQDQGTISLQDLSTSFASLRSERPKEFQALRVYDMAVSLAVSVAKRDLAAWKPLKKPKEGISAIASWKGALEDRDVKAVTLLCDEVLLPKLRVALIDWSVRDFESCIQLFECCQKNLPTDATEELGAHVILPRLQVEVDNWDPRTDKMPVHIWIHPWLPILGKKLNSLWTPIRFKLSACLDQWDPSDRSACAVLKPWQHVFEPANWEPLVEKLLLKLERAISSTPVLPSGQDLKPIEDLLAWLDIVPVDLVARVLETALFPQWHKALRHWLRSPECDFNEVLQWYQGWRTLLPEIVREQGSVQKQLASGLEVMKNLMSGDGAADSEDDDGDDDAEEPPPPQAPGSPPKSTSRIRSEPNIMAEDVTISLSDYMADVAAEHGLEFRPKGGTHLGKKVYKFGSVSIYFDKNLVYAAPRGGGEEWLPVSFDEVLKLAMRAK